MFKPNPVEFELPDDQGLLLQLRGEWIAERKVEGVRAVLDFGTFKTLHGNLQPPGPLPQDWQGCVLDGCLAGSVYYLFDLLVLDGEDVRRRPLHERRTLLRSLRLPDWCRLVPCGKNIGEFLEAVIRDGGSGIVVKNLLERYGEAQWIKVEQPRIQEVVVTGIDLNTRSVMVGDFRDGELVELGPVFLGSLLDQACVGQVMEVEPRGSTPAGALGQARFVRFRADKLDLEVWSATPGSSGGSGRFIRFRPEEIAEHFSSQDGL